jgi:hypothetical protein
MLGLSLHGWENAMVVFLIVAGFTAFVAGAATWAVVRLQRIAIEEAKLESDKYKLDTSKQIAEANERTASSELELMRLRMPRMPDGDRFGKELAGVAPPAAVEILYVAECSDCWMLADMIGGLFTRSNWHSSVAPIQPLPNPPDWLSKLPPTLQHRANPTGLTILRNEPPSDVAAKTPSRSIVRAIMNSVNGANLMVASDPDLPADVVKIVIAPKL